MDYYIDVQITPDAEMRENVLLNKVYTKCHKALWTMKSTDVGVSFPDFKIRLGHIMRIHGSEERFKYLEKIKWLGGLSGYCIVSPVQPVPTEKLRFRTISRKQANMTQAKLRRLIKRRSISPNEAKGYKSKMFKQGLDCPYLELQSASNGKKHRRYLLFGDILDKPKPGIFDSFGLSKSATIPWF